jgi:iron complex transport system substrate-binding protein
MNTRTPRALVALVAGVSLITAACGSDDDAASTPSPSVTDDASATTAAPGDEPASTAPSSTPAESADDPADAGAPPERIVSLSPTHTEMLFAVGAADRLVAVDEFSDFPAEALELPNDLSGFEPNVEAIAAYEPDLVVIGGDFTGLGEQLDAIGIAWWDGPAAMTLDDTYTQIEQLGAVTGQIAEAAELVAQMQTDIDAIVAETDVPDEPLTFYHELDPTYFSADSTTFIGELYSLLGLQNIADRAEGDSGGFPQLNAEFIVSADPDLIFLADTKCCGESAGTVAARDGWGAISAVVNGNVIEMDDDIASRWGPRVVDYLAAVSAAVERALVAA